VGGQTSKHITLIARNSASGMMVISVGVWVSGGRVGYTMLGLRTSANMQCVPTRVICLSFVHTCSLWVKHCANQFQNPPTTTTFKIACHKCRLWQPLMGMPGLCMTRHRHAAFAAK